LINHTMDANDAWLTDHKDIEIIMQEFIFNIWTMSIKYSIKRDPTSTISVCRTARKFGGPRRK